MRENSSGNDRAMALRLDSTYDTPLGTRTLSSSTRQLSASSRITSMPATWMRTPLAGATPTAAMEVHRRQDQPPQHAVGDHPLQPVDVGEQRFERPHPLGDAGCQVIPLGPVEHAGTESSRNGRSSPPMSKVTPWLR